MINIDSVKREECKKIKYLKLSSYNQGELIMIFRTNQ